MDTGRRARLAGIANTEGGKAKGPAVAPERKRKPPKLTRIERADILREKILVAAADVVGEHGYQNASIGRIALAAEIAQGTIYLYFDTRQALFDDLLPHAGQDMMHFIGDQVKGARDFVEVEERGVRAFFAYLTRNPGFYRVLNEAEFAAPAGHKTHFKQLADHYVASMRRSVDSGKLAPFGDDELRVLAYIMMSARSYLFLSYIKYGGARAIPEYVIQTYLGIVRSLVSRPRSIAGDGKKSEETISAKYAMPTNC